LHYAIAANNQRATKVLIAVGADPELSAQGFGRSFLFAMTLKNMEMLSLLLNLRPINTLSKDTLDYLLLSSVEDDCRSCLELILARGVPIDFPDGAGFTILMRTMDAQDYQLAEWLLQKGASVHVEAKKRR
jgi:ankyrin repeat protein